MEGAREHGTCQIHKFPSPRCSERRQAELWHQEQQKDWSVSFSMMHWGCFTPGRFWKVPESRNGRWVQEYKPCLGDTCFEHITCAFTDFHPMLLLSHSKVNQSIWVESFASESFLWDLVSSVTGVRSLMRRAAFMCSCCRRGQAALSGAIQIQLIHAQPASSKLMRLGKVTLRKRSKGFSKCEKKKMTCYCCAKLTLNSQPAPEANRVIHVLPGFFLFVCQLTRIASRTLKIKSDLPFISDYQACLWSRINSH